jgi:hypothetical protein
MTWEELLKNRAPMPPLRNSAHMLMCRAAVKGKFPVADIVQVTKDSWQLRNGAVNLSNPHNSHYACWAEAYDVMGQAS